MKIFTLFTFFIILSGCTAINFEKVAPAYQSAFKAIKASMLGYEEFITPEIIKNIPYASSKVSIGNGPNGLMILESVDDDIYTWVSADEVYLILKNGKIIKTKGLSNNITNLIAPYFFDDSEILKASEKLDYKFYYSYDNPFLANLEVSTRYRIKGKEIISILDQEKKLTLVHEEISNRIIGWNEINKYWIDEEGFVWKSEQHISPRLPKVVFEITKKPS